MATQMRVVRSSVRSALTEKLAASSLSTDGDSVSGKLTPKSVLPGLAHADSSSECSDSSPRDERALRPQTTDLAIKPFYAPPMTSALFAKCTARVWPRAAASPRAAPLTKAAARSSAGCACGASCGFCDGGLASAFMLRALRCKVEVAEHGAAREAEGRAAVAAAHADMPSHEAHACVPWLCRAWRAPFAARVKPPPPAASTERVQHPAPAARAPAVAEGPAGPVGARAATAAVPPPPPRMRRRWLSAHDACAAAAAAERLAEQRAAVRLLDEGWWFGGGR